MASDKWTYNIPGCGNLTANIFDYTKHVYSYLDYYGHIDRLRKINQLGRLREVFQGAHHNRYEYVFLQLALVSQLCEHKNSTLGLSATRSFCGKITDMGKDPTVGELLQCMVILNNIGYLEGTFATARAWITFLKTNRVAYRCFRNGLDSLDRKCFDEIVDKYNYYQFNLILALFLLQRYKRKSLETSIFCSNVVRVYLKNDKTDIQLIELRRLFQSIRQLAFLALDSFYAPVPFRIDLSAIILNFNSLQDSLFIKNTTYKVALNNLELVLQDSVYLSSDSCLNTSRASDQEIEFLVERGQNIKTSGDLFDLVCAQYESDINNNRLEALDWKREKKLIQEFKKTSNADGKILTHLSDEVSWERRTRSAVGKSGVRVSLLKNHNQTSLRLVFGITSQEDTASLKLALKITEEVVRFHRDLNESQYESLTENLDWLMQFILKSIFGWEKRFLLNNKVSEHSAVLVSNGKENMLSQIDAFLSVAGKYLNPDEIFEVEKVRDLITKVKYSGLTKDERWRVLRRSFLLPPPGSSRPREVPGHG